MKYNNQISTVINEVNLTIDSMNSPMYEDLKKSNSQKNKKIVKRLDERFSNLMGKIERIDPYREIVLFGLEPYLEQLIVARKVLQEEIWDFPKNSCEMAAKVVSQVTGLEEVAGNCEYDSKCYHSWNFDPERGLFLCITLNQYKEEGFPVSWRPANAGILNVLEIPTKNQWLYKRADVDEYAQKIKNICGRKENDNRKIRKIKTN
ncbi:MAG: hypothetical protein PHH54_06450 [Candidatus Nanoarchaeia archaeon]|nr:hypothetical protein [Candidatus Nanoarchaeia archaeon]MDD5741596.1 hypothetical protein [Candidatus Nanoarchaeia archaeon]